MGEHLVGFCEYVFVQLERGSDFGASPPTRFAASYQSMCENITLVYVTDEEVTHHIVNDG